MAYKKKVSPATKAKRYQEALRSGNLKDTQKAWRKGYLSAYKECRRSAKTKKASWRAWDSMSEMDKSLVKNLVVDKYFDRKIVRDGATGKVLD